MNLQDYGWDAAFAKSWEALAEPGYVPARVTADFGTMLHVVKPEDLTAELSGNLRAADSVTLPKVGDWVALQVLDDKRAVIQAVLPRRSDIARRAAGPKPVKQIMAANVDIAFVLQAFGNDFSPERLQRYLYQLTAGNIQPVLVLNKADQVAEVASYVKRAEVLGVPCIVCSAKTGQGVDDIMALIKPGKTAVLLGSSGVGKSTLTNRLLGEQLQKTQEVRSSDATGRHTTTHRELFVLPGGGLLIDTPGIRELQLWGSEEDLDENFDDIAGLITQCKFNNCQHGSEEGCAIRAALLSGSLTQSHYNNYIKLKHELAALATKTNKQAEYKNRKTPPKFSRRAGKHISEDDDS